MAPWAAPSAAARADAGRSGAELRSRIAEDCIIVGSFIFSRSGYWAYPREGVLIRGLAMMIIIGLWSLAAWFGSGRFATERAAQEIERIRLETNTRARTTGEYVLQRLTQVRGIPIVIADEPSVADQLARLRPEGDARPEAQRKAAFRADPELNGLSHRLRRIAFNLNLDSLFVLNAGGDCVAEGHLPGNADFIGVNYADRAYFIAARDGNHGHLLAVGRVSNTPAIYFCSPVIPPGGQFLGAVTARADLASLFNQIREHDTFVTDENGVVVLAGDPALLMRALPDAPIAQVPPAERLQRYKRVDFQALDLAPFGPRSPELLRLNRAPWPCLLGTYTSPDRLLSVHVLGDLKALVDIQRDRHWLFAWATLTGILAVTLTAGGVHYLNSSRRHERELAYQAQTDELTRCANRRHFLEALKTERQRWTRYGAPFSLLSLDLDHFKLVNDQHGHPCGDEVLRHFVATVLTILRPTDLLGRMGGEEFAILLPQTNLERAALIAERIRALVEASPALHHGEAVPVTVSVGVAQWHGHDGETVDGLLNRSDQALYQAKELGRNRVAGLA